MTKALVTGATGFVGNAVARLLIKKGRDVRVLARKSSNHKLLQNLDAEVVYGDLRDSDSLKQALNNCEELYHVAAQYTFYNPNPKDIYDSNVQGTHNILKAALQRNLTRVVYTSTVGAIGIPSNGDLGDEETPISLFDCKGHYKRSKFLAEQEASRYLSRYGLAWRSPVDPEATPQAGTATPTTGTPNTS